MATAILGYKTLSCFGVYDEPGGWSFVVYRKGTVRFKKYLMNGTVTGSKKTRIPLTTTDKLYQTLFRHKACITSLPESTNNGSCDGAFDYFYFLGKKVTSLNIERTDEEVIQQFINSPKGEMMRTENIILNIFESVASILKPYGLCVQFVPNFYCSWEGCDFSG